MTHISSVREACFVIGATAALFGLAACAPISESQQIKGVDEGNLSVITTASGDLRGVIDDAKEFVSFLGIPFARPPVGELRWAAPLEPESWEGVRDASTFGPDCAQVAPAQGSWSYSDGSVYSEDCLYLNVYAPRDALDRDEPVPVMFWIYGGGFFAGGSSQPVYRDPSVYTDRGVILVTVNYRVGAFGYLAHPDLSATSVNGTSGNYGTMDQIAALEWVQQNIAAFGGDADNVTVFGESAGAVSGNVLLSTPSAEPLFDKVIMQSGGIWGLTPYMKSKEAAERWGQAFLSARGAQTAEQARALPAEAITGLKPEEMAEHMFGFQPIADGVLTPRTTGDTFLLGEQADKPFIIGWTRQEAGGFIVPEPSEEDMKAYFIRQFGSAGPELMAGYLQAEGNYRSAMVAASTAAIASGSLTGAELHLAKTPDIYVYRFDRALPGEVNQQKGAVHGDDVGFTFGFFPEGLDWSEADRKLSSDLLDYWVAFAKTGRPEVGGLPDWPAYSAEAHSIMRLDAPVHAGPLEQYELIKKTMKTDDYSRFSELRKQQ